MKINEKNLCVFATSPPYDYEGFLNKRGEVNKAFQRRYFVLKGNLLFYFEKKGDKEPLGLIIVEGCTIELSEENDQYCFEIAFNGNRTYVLSADTQNSMEAWMKALTCAGYEYKKLMVAELQRQLEEIDDCRKKNLNKICFNSSAPKPPPRRQNPFNRPAPPVPPVPNGSKNNMPLNGTVPSSSTVASEGIISATPLSSSAERNLLHNNPFVATKTTATSHIFNLYSENIKSLAKLNGSNFTFDQFQDRLRDNMLKDVFEYRKQKEVKQKPLIDI